uniref:Uncharacterized protein n=1 Tax=Nelumbo nucifera TaxID=4432 RepID=A0A822YQW5_NELNU|nr:TPA_asm: hypothetical protein HUJ06_005612 [Nelumbo nucifera]
MTLKLLHSTPSLPSSSSSLPLPLSTLCQLFRFSGSFRLGLLADWIFLLILQFLWTFDFEPCSAALEGLREGNLLIGLLIFGWTDGVGTYLKCYYRIVSVVFIRRKRETDLRDSEFTYIRECSSSI